MNKTTLLLSLLLPLTVLLASCGTNSVVVKPGYDFKNINRVAVLGFKDTPYSTKGTLVAELFDKYLLQSGYNIVERDELDSILKEHQLSLSGAINPEQIKTFGKISGIDAIITGTITMDVPERDFYENGYPRFIAAQVGVTCRMISVETGEVLWVGSDTYDGANDQTAFEYLIASIVNQLMKDMHAAAARGQ
jgi:curli biogenesis system outer membrane secretion channel CsgG